MSRGRDFDLCGMRLSVVTFDGTVQVLFLQDGWPDGARQVVANRFASRATAAELRAIADHLDGLPWVDESAVATGAGAAVPFAESAAVVALRRGGAA